MSTRLVDSDLFTESVYSIHKKGIYYSVYYSDLSNSQLQDPFGLLLLNLMASEDLKYATCIIVFNMTLFELFLWSSNFVIEKKKYY